MKNTNKLFIEFYAILIFFKLLTTNIKNLELMKVKVMHSTCFNSI